MITALRPDQPCFCVEVGRTGGLPDDRGRFEGAHRTVDVPGAPELLGHARVEAAEIEPATGSGQLGGVVG